MFLLNKSTLAILLLGLIVGCKPRDEIAVVEVEKSPPREAVDVDAIAGRLDHMLAAVVPQGKKAWFFKLVAPAKGAARHKEEFLTFLQSVQLSKDDSQKPAWQAPDGWEEKPGTGMRAATFVVPDGRVSENGGPLELTVTSLPQSGPWDDYVVSNVNRWLGQLQQSPLDKETIEPLLNKVSLPGEAEATWIELAGVMSRQDGMSGGLPSGHPPIAGSPAVESPAAKQGAPPATASASPLAYETPEGWLPGRIGGMRKAAFQVGEGETKAEVTVIDLPVQGAAGIADVEANVRRWAAQVGLLELDEAKLAKMIQPTEIDGVAGKQTLLLGPEDADHPQGLLAAMIQRDGKVWFFKMIGDRPLVKSQQQAFTRFLESIHFKTE